VCPLKCRYMKVQVELLWVCRIRPARRDIAVNGLERQHRTGGCVKSRPAIANGPPRVRLIDTATKQRAIERR
jgi:hypothetical protein